MLEVLSAEMHCMGRCKPAEHDLFDEAPVAMAVTFCGRLLRVNREFTRLFGFEAGDCVGRDIDALLLPDDRAHENDILRDTVATEGRASMETMRRTAEGVAVAVSVLIAPLALSGTATGLFHIFRDIRGQKEQEARLQYCATHDALTGLPNRALFLDRLRLTLARLQRRPERSFAVMLLDLDFGAYDTLGHVERDAALLEMTRRLHDRVRPQDTVARFGGDVFALLLDEAGRREDVDNIADRLRETVQEQMMLASRQVAMSANIGIVLVTSAYECGDDVVGAAHLALARAKAGGKARHAFAAAPHVGGATMLPCPPSARSPQPA
ncbi:MAG: sensor domain-containing diguanylate cyclase [Acidobacteriaceae bacterium]